MELSSRLTALPGIGPALAARFSLLGVKNVYDLITYWPRRYDDYSHVVPMNQLQPGKVTLLGTISIKNSRYVRRGMHLTEAIASDDSGSVQLVWFNQPYRAATFKQGQLYYISGDYQLNRQRFSLLNPTVEAAQEFTTNTARIVPIYRETKGLTSKQIRSAVMHAIGQASLPAETLPAWLLKDYKLTGYAVAISAMHFPNSSEALAAARRRLGFEEVLQLSLASQLTKRQQQLEKALPVPFSTNLAKEFVAELPFTLTDDQRAASWQIFQDMQQPLPMNRLLEGDVGSGKTVVAAMAGIMAMSHNFQVAVMAPTELLARQHAVTLTKLLDAHGYANQVCLLVGSMTKAQKQRAHQAIQKGLARCIVGTHALIQDDVDMHALALVVIDEQHRFGVNQRKALLLKAGHMPHVLSMTATPIPRTLALTLYGEMDVTVLKHKPANRKPIITELVAPTEQAALYKKLQAELKGGRQIFVVCPLIQDSDSLEANSAEATFERLQTGPFKQWRIGLLHGKLKPDVKQAVMQQFLVHELDIIVSTTVIEVGVDVPNASVMLIESPERFGLAQLHQLRGRVGRSGHQGYCYLLLSDSKSPSRRLRALESSNDGFRLSELDLELRGPGAIYGSMQHGALDLRIAQLTDTALIADAQQAAKKLLDHDDLLQYNELASAVARLQTVTNLN